ncbi:hypothetical protein Tco_0278342 [Tanacetum coccineum]
MEKELIAHQKTILTLSHEKDAQEKYYKTREEKELDKVIVLENKIKVLDNIVYKASQLVQTMNMLNHNCKMSFVKPEFLKKAKSENPRMYDIGCYNYNLALTLAPEFDDTIRRAQESQSKLKLACNYLEALKKCKNLETELSKSKTQQTDKRFANLEQRCIDLELDLQHEKENNVCENSWVKQSLRLGDSEKALKDKIDSLIVELNRKTIESHDLRAQLQDKIIANAEMLRELAIAKPHHVHAPGPSRNGSKTVLKTSPRESIGSNYMVYKYYLDEAKKKAQIQKENALNSKPSMQKTARLPNTASGRKPKPMNFYQQPRNWPPSMNSRVSNKAIYIEEPPRNSKIFLNSKHLACPTCKKCIYTANHDARILQYRAAVNSHASAQTKGAQSSRITKRYIPVEKKSDTKKHEKWISTGHMFFLNKSFTMYVKTTPPRSGLT